MANKDAPSGLKPVKHLSGAPWSGKTNMYLIPASDGTPVFMGDPVALAGSTGEAGTTVNGQDVEGMPTIKQAAAGSTPMGVVVGFLPNQANLEQLYRPSSVARIALVVDDPSVVFEVQEDSDTSTLAAADIGENCDLVIGSGNTTTGVSTAEIDSDSHITATATVRVMRLVPRADNAIGTNAKYEVIFNEHAYKGTVGV